MFAEENRDISNKRYIANHTPYNILSLQIPLIFCI
jgi:hypothetical protein